MTFKEALEKMKQGYTVKRPHWAGFGIWIPKTRCSICTQKRER